MIATDTHTLLDAATRLEDPAEGLAAVCDLRRHLDQLQTVHVENALRAGWSWSQVADSLGVSRQAAHRRYAALVRERLGEVRDSRNGSTNGLTVTGAARLVMHLGRQEAGALRRPQLGTEHVLLGLLRLEAGPARSVLRDAGVELAAARAAVAELHAEETEEPRFTRDQLSPSPQCRAALERSIHEAARRGEDRLRPEHLLVAILRDPASGAARALARLGVETEPFLVAF